MQRGVRLSVIYIRVRGRVGRIYGGIIGLDLGGGVGRCGHACVMYEARIWEFDTR